MQISLTKKLSKAIGLKPDEADETIDPLFCWTANWTNTFSDRKEDMVVLVNQASRFTVAIYGIRRNQFKDIEAKIIAAIRNTLLALKLNPELVEDYIAQAGEVTYAVNRNPKMTACVNRQGLEASFFVGRFVNDSDGKVKYIDTLGSAISRGIVNYGKASDEAFCPSEKMAEMLTELTGKPTYKYRAFELSVVLDLDVYKAVRRLIVPADIELTEFHKLLQRVFNWENSHLYEFTVYDEGSNVPVCSLAHEVGMAYGSAEMSMDGRKLSDYLPGQTLVYTYDMGDSWEHRIEVVRVIEEHDGESPYLLEASGQTPPEDVGGVGGFIHFRTALLDPDHPDHKAVKQWAQHWKPDLPEWHSRPKLLRWF